MNLILENIEWLVDTDSASVVSEALPYQFHFTSIEYNEDGRATNANLHHNISLQEMQNSDDIYIIMRLAGKAFFNAMNKKIAICD